MTDLRATQVGLEVWASGTPTIQTSQVGLEVWVEPNAAIQTTQLGLEVWTAVVALPRYVLATQIGLEVWFPVPSQAVTVRVFLHVQT